MLVWYHKELPDEVGASKPGKSKSPHAKSRNPSGSHILPTSVRRTRHSKECVQAPPNLGIWIEDPPVPQVTISDSEQEGFQFDSEDTAVPPEFANPYVEDTEDKLDYVIELTETNGRKLDALVSKVSVFITCHPLLIFLGFKLWVFIIPLHFGYWNCLQFHMHMKPGRERKFLCRWRVPHDI